MYKGNTISESDFGRLAIRAGSYLDKLTGGRISDPPSESIKMATCAVAEAWQVNEQGGEIASQSVGSWTKTFTPKVKSDNQRLYEAAILYLDASNIIARWL
jgi:hypothetical protein